MVDPRGAARKDLIVRLTFYSMGLLGVGLGCALLGAGGCNGGKDGFTTTLSTLSNPTLASDPSNGSQGEDTTPVGTSGTGEATDTTGTASAPTTGGPGGDPSGVTTTAASGTTTVSDTDVDPSTTSVDPSTTTSDDTTGVITTRTTDTTTGDPPGKDPQPDSGLYESCLENAVCDANTDGCFTIADANMNIIAGYCTLLCTKAADCGPALDVPATQVCLPISADQKVCGYKCADTEDCPTGMDCLEINLPDNTTGFFCF